MELFDVTIFIGVAFVAFICGCLEKRVNQLRDRIDNNNEQLLTNLKQWYSRAVFTKKCMKCNTIEVIKDNE